MDLKDLLKELDENLVVTNSEKKGKVIYINCEMNTEESVCPYCGEISNKVHSKYVRKLSDLPIQNYEVKLHLLTRKFFCLNHNCSHKTFGEKYNFVENKSVKTKRLINYINNIGLRDNSMDAVRSLSETGISVSSSTVLRIIKKNKAQHNL